MIALDTNILVYAQAPASREYGRARRALEKLRGHPTGWGVALPVLAESWSVLTRGDQPHPAPPARVRAFLELLLTAGAAQVWLPSPALPAALLASADRAGVRGRRIYDLQIALIALENGADELWTHDGGFVRVPGLRYFDPITHGARR